METVEFKTFKEVMDECAKDNLTDEQVKTRIKTIEMCLLFEIKERLKRLN